MTVITRMARPDRERLVACLDSVRHQTSPAWQHIVIDDGTSEPWARDVVDGRAAQDDRFVVLKCAQRRSPAAAYNDALEIADGPLLMLLGDHDVLAPEAIARLSPACPSSNGVAYADHDVVGGVDGHGPPFHKPDFSPELLRNTNYITRPVVASLDLVNSIGRFRDGFGSAHDHDFVLRLTEQADNVAHVPEVLVHHHAENDDAENDDAENDDAEIDQGDDCGAVAAWADVAASSDAGRRAVADHCSRVGIDASVEATEHAGYYRVRRTPASSPLVSVVIPTRGSSGRVWGVSRSFVIDAVASIIELSTYQHLEFVVVYDELTPSAVLRTLERVAGGRLRLVPFGAEFNFSAKVNVGVTAAAGDLLLVLNDDTELIEPDSIATMVAHLDVGDVGMVGAKLLFADGTMQHGGHIYNGGPMHACFGWRGDSPGPIPLRPLAVERECSGVTAAAALVRRSVFETVGGFETALALNYNDVDFCLKARAAGHRILWTPHASWYHFESQTRESVLLAEEQQFIEDRWHDEMHNDPYYNPNLQPGRHDWLERPSESRGQ